MGRLLPLSERDALFASYRSWLAVTTTLLSHADAAMKGQRVDWCQLAREVNVLDGLQRNFITRLKNSLDADELDDSVAERLGTLPSELRRAQPAASPSSVDARLLDRAC